MSLRGWVTGDRKQRQAIVADQAGIIWFSNPYKTDKAAKGVAETFWPGQIKWEDKK